MVSLATNESVPSQTLARLYARPGFLLRRAHQISAAVFEDECRTVGLTPAQFGVLTVLRATPGLDQSSLARALGFDKVTVLRVLRGLEARGLVARAPSPASRRNLSIALSDHGLELLAQAQRPAEMAYERLMAPLDAVQREQLVALLQQLTEGLEGEARAAFVPPDLQPAPGRERPSAPDTPTALRAPAP
jgi:MarR family transcriptional regulator, lower aerobic nicotinate degradation pathway regulator